jgi:hypothetical protein
MSLPMPPGNDDAKKLLEDLLERTLGEAPQADALEEEGSSEPAPDPEQAQRAAEQAGDGQVPDYAGPYATRKEREQLVRDVALRDRLVRAARRKGVPEPDVEDVAQEAVTSAYMAPKLPGGGGDPRDRYAFGVLGYKIAEFWRKKYKERELAERAKAYFAKPVQAADPVPSATCSRSCPRSWSPSRSTTCAA